MEIENEIKKEEEQKKSLLKFSKSNSTDDITKDNSRPLQREIIDLSHNNVEHLINNSYNKLLKVGNDQRESVKKQIVAFFHNNQNEHKNIENLLINLADRRVTALTS